MFFYSIFSDQERGSGVVLIPLDQGCFLFALPYTITTTDYCLNPFGSGMFFIQIAKLENENGKQVLIPLDQGCFLFTAARRCLH